MRTYLSTTGLSLLLAIAAFGATTTAGATDAYVIANQGALGLAKAFDDGQNTVLAFADLDSQTPKLTDSAGKTIKYRRVGDYAVLPGHFNDVKIDVAGVKGAVKAASTTPGAADTAPVALSAYGRRASEMDVTVSAVSGGSHCAKTGLLAPSSDVAGVTLTCRDGYWVAMAGRPVEGTVATATASDRALPTVGSPKAQGSTPGSQTASSTTTPAVTAPPPVPKPTVPVWDGAAGTDAKTMLTAWAGKAGWHVDWEAKVTFPIPSPVHYSMPFLSAVSKHYGVYTDRLMTKDAVCIDVHTENVTIHVYPRDDSGKCNQPLPSPTNALNSTSQAAR